MSIIDSSTQAKEALTPLEIIIDRVLKMMLVIVGLFTVLLLVKYFRMDIGIPVDAAIDAFSVIFSLAPASLFFMILLTYASGSADMIKMGALVDRARSIEYLAQVNVVCFSKAGALMGTNVDLDFSISTGSDKNLSGTWIRQVLGDYARTLSVLNQTTLAIVNSIEGNPRDAVAQAPYLSTYGWSAIAFDLPDLEGVYYLGEKDVMESHLQSPEIGDSTSQPEEERESNWRRTFGRVGRLFGRSHDDHSGDQAMLQPGGLDTDIDDVPTSDAVQVDEEIADDGEKPGLFRRLGNRLTSLVSRGETSRPEEDEGRVRQIDELVYVFAYTPELQPIHDSQGAQVLGKNLIPLCELRYSERIHPGAVRTLNQFYEDGVKVIGFSPEPAEKSARMLEQAGWSRYEEDSPGMIDGPELDRMEEQEFKNAAIHNEIFGQMTPWMESQVVKKLRQDGNYVAVIGDDVSDVPAMKEANLAIALHTSNQIARSTADIILLEEPHSALQRVVEKGQRIVNGLLDVLKLYLTQILYLTFLIVAVQVFAYGFPYKSSQGSVVSTLAIALPAVGFSLWAAAGVVVGSRLGDQLAGFIGPASITIAAAAMFVYAYILGQYQDINYAQLALTYTLFGIGLLLILIMKPPILIQVGGAIRVGDLRFTIIVIVAFFAFMLAVSLPLLQDLLKLGHLEHTKDYLVVIIAAGWWAVTFVFSRRLWPFIGSRTSNWLFKAGQSGAK